MSHPNALGNAVRFGDGKTDFLEALADWLEKWHNDCPKSCCLKGMIL